MKIVNFKKEVDGDKGLADDLRALADRIESGEVVDFIACYIDPDDDNYKTFRRVSLAQALVMTTLLHTQTVNKLQVKE